MATPHQLMLHRPLMPHQIMHMHPHRHTGGAAAASGHMAPTATPIVRGSGLSKEVISRFLETIRVCEDGDDDDDDGDLCSVCLDDLRGGDRRGVGVLECRHRFHADCIGEWLLRQNNCPLCKAIGIKIDRVMKYFTC